MASKSVFELNGKAYDALTGAVLGSARRPEQRLRVAAMAPKAMPRYDDLGQHAHHQAARSLDGFVGGKRASGNHVSAHQPQHTKTLMRRAVKAPQAGLANMKAGHLSGVFRAQRPMPASTTVSPNVQPKLSAISVDPQRAQRAHKVSHSKLIKHFSPLAGERRAPADIAAAGQQPAAVQLMPKPATGKPFRRPADQAARAMHDRTVPPVKDDQDIFARALDGRHPDRPVASPASGKKSRRRGKLAGITAMALLFVGTCGFVAYQNKSTIQLQLASAKAGFSASIPLYKPAGYHLDNLVASSGNVAASFSGGNNQNFVITQQKSNWDSQTLLENFVATSNDPYQGYQSGGRTIYVFGQGKATWVNGGIWYQIKNADNLTNDQLVKIAASM